jgi:hypothetical protein
VPITKTIDNGHSPISLRLKDYVEKCVDVCGEPLLNDIFDTKNWHREMNETRRIYGHDRPTPRGRPRHYYHYTIRPDALSGLEADLSLDHLRFLANTWAGRIFSDYQYAIGFHYNEYKDKDGKAIGRAPGYHAHIIVNCTNMATRSKLHLDDREALDIVNRCNDIAAELGMSRRKALKPKSHGQVSTKTYLTQAERELMAKGITPWKEKVRQTAKVAAEKSIDFGQFQRKMRSAGCDAWQTKRGITFACQYKGRTVTVRDYRLGADFIQDYLSRLYTVKQFLSVGHSKQKTLAGQLRYKSHVLDMGNGRYRHLRASSSQAIADALSVIERRAITTPEVLYALLDAERRQAGLTGERLAEFGEARVLTPEALACVSELEILKRDIVELNQTATVVSDVLNAALKAENAERRRLGLTERRIDATKVKRLPRGITRPTLGELGINFDGRENVDELSERLHYEIGGVIDIEKSNTSIRQRNRSFTHKNRRAQNKATERRESGRVK